MLVLIFFRLSARVNITQVGWIMEHTRKKGTFFSNFLFLMLTIGMHSKATFLSIFGNSVLDTNAQQLHTASWFPGNIWA